MSLAVITGASSGIGAALAKALIAHTSDLKVAVVARRKDLLNSVSAFQPSRIIPVEADITTDEGIKAVTAAVAASGLPLSLLVHNAGMIGEIGPLVSASREAWEKTMALNVNAPLYLTQALLPFFSSTSSSRILTIGSGAASSVIEGWGSYCTSKAGFLMLARVLDAELAAKSPAIRVGSVRPGIVDTPMQTVIRTTGDFPAKDRFVAFKEARDTHHPAGASSGEVKKTAYPPPPDELDDAGNVGAFLSWLLRETGDEEFGLSTGKEWDIRDKAHHDRWCGKVEIVG